MEMLGAVASRALEACEEGGFKDPGTKRSTKIAILQRKQQSERHLAELQIAERRAAMLEQVKSEDLMC